MIIKLHYPRPNAIRVKQRKPDGTEIKVKALPEIVGADGNMRTVDENLTECGRNIYFHHNYTTHFLINGHSDCQVWVTLSNSIKLTTRFEMPIADFYNQGGETIFVDRMSALLRINDTSRIKIVGVYTGSTTVVTMIMP